MKHILSVIQFVPKILLRKLHRCAIDILLLSANNSFGGMWKETVEGESDTVPTFTSRD